MADYAKWSPHHSGRGGASVIWLAVHTAEGATTADSLANYLANPKNKVSYHVVCDDSTTIQCVDYGEGAWALRGGNSRSDQICCTGFAGWSRVTWLSHQGMLDRFLARLAAGNPFSLAVSSVDFWHAAGHGAGAARDAGAAGAAPAEI